MKTAILHAGQAPFALIPKHGDYDDMSKTLLGLRPTDAKTYPVLDNIFPASVDDYDLYLITGSPCGAYEEYPWISQLEGFIRKAFESNIKLIGLCFGHQIMAQAMGGTVIKSDKGYGIGVMDYHLTHPAFKQQTISLCAWHQDQVVTQPPNSDIFLSSEFCPIAGLTYGTQAMSVQPHPEFSTAFVKNMISVRRGDTISNSIADKAEATLDKDTDTLILQKIIQTIV